MIHENFYFKNINLDITSVTDIFLKSKYYNGIKGGINDGIYWELVLDKNTKKESYNYYLYYSLTPEEAIAQFDEVEKVQIKQSVWYKQITSIIDINTKDILERVIYLNV